MDCFSLGSLVDTMIKVDSKWVDSNGKMFYVSHVQDGVVFYRTTTNPYCCNIEAFLARFSEIKNYG